MRGGGAENDALKRLLQSVGPRTELALVLGLAFGSAVVRSLSHLAFHRAEPALQAAHMQRAMLLFELPVLALLGAFLKQRGWTRQRLGAVPHLSDVPLGVGLCIAAYALYALAWYATEAAAPQLIAQIIATPLIEGSFSIAMVVLLSCVNALFEETFVCAYLVTALEPRVGIAPAMSASIALRLLYHLYQGPLAVISIVPLGLLYTSWFVKTRRLWPLVIAHSLADIAALAQHLR